MYSRYCPYCRANRQFIIGLGGFSPWFGLGWGWHHPWFGWGGGWHHGWGSGWHR